MFQLFSFLAASCSCFSLGRRSRFGPQLHRLSGKRCATASLVKFKALASIVIALDPLLWRNADDELLHSPRLASPLGAQSPVRVVVKSLGATPRLTGNAPSAAETP
jgi:hypothetical protein